MRPSMLSVHDRSLRPLRCYRYGYVCKVVHGYQILTIDFAKTRGMSGWVKRKGAVSTQRIPAFSSLFDVSSGVSGATDTSSMDPGTAYSARVATPDGLDLVRVSGVLQPIQTNEDARLCEFVVCHAACSFVQPVWLIPQTPSQIQLA